MFMPKVSVIIPVYNVEKYLRECLDSVVNQTLQDIEIICVDDGSTDSSLKILEEYAQKDTRINIHSLCKSCSALIARKKGVLAANGEYILFLDADDYLELNACEELYNKIKEEKVEILHFNSRIENCANISQDRIDMNIALLRPLTMHLLNKDIFDQCFQYRNYGFTLWNKIFSTSLCKKAFFNMVDEYLPKAQDMYSYFIISYFAESYLGWDSKIYHHYCFGRGVTASLDITLDTFERYCLQSRVIEALEQFCNEKDLDEFQLKVISKYKIQWINECIELWMKSNIEDATKILFRSWNAIDLVEQISRKYWYDRDIVARKIKNTFDIPLNSKNAKTIALYYYHFTIGGVQRVISLLIPLYINMGYKVIFITDKDYSEQDLILNERVERIIIQDYQETNKDNYRIRAEQWKLIIEQYSIDILLYHAWTSPLLFWDMLLLKLLNVAVIVQTHSIFSHSLISLNRDFSILPRILALCDGLVVLSEVDKTFWKCFNNNVHLIPNPINPNLINATLSNGDNNYVIWVGRFSDEKQPWEALNIMEKVIKRYPSAKLMMLGDSKDSSVLNKYIQIAEQKGISQNIQFLGYQKNVESYYEKASINLNTSTYEGFSMTLLEAQAHGLPTVMYDMPYLDLAKSSKGIISVEPNNSDAAAIEICNLLQNRIEWKEKSSLALKSFREYAEYDYIVSWEKILKGEKQENITSDATTLMLDTLITHYSLGWKKNNKIIKELKTSKNNITFSLWFLNKLRGGIQCYKDHGLKYTVKRFFFKVKRKLTKSR